MTVEEVSPGDLRDAALLLRLALSSDLLAFVPVPSGRERALAILGATLLRQWAEAVELEPEMLMERVSASLARATPEDVGYTGPGA